MSQSKAINLLIVEDDDGFRETATHWLQRQGHHVEQSPNGADALHIAGTRHFDVAIVDMNMPGISGMEVLQRMHEQCPDTEIIILTGQATVDNAVEAMKLGATDYLTKPFPLGDLERRCLQAAERGRLNKENRQLRTLLDRSKPKTKIIGESPSMKEVFRVVNRVAPTEKAVLIQGESGTGKELIAQAIQERSTRVDRPFVTINCAALPETLVESELFGHEKGSFTGANDRKYGLFEVADGGTLFVDEIGELPLSLQPKLLRVLENGSLRRVGSHQERVVNVRVIAATNRDLKKEVENGRFREDLYYRINVITLDLPPLRHRHGDVALLVDDVLGSEWEIEQDAFNALLRYDWPGNVRQLLNALDRAMVMAEDHLITIDDLPKEVVEATGREVLPHSESTNPSISDLATIEKRHIVEVLEHVGHNKAQAARVLGIHRRKLYRLLERYEIESNK
ncbi:sigma-54 dependent transcriptional regulator [Thalassoglobus sp. JC818]|uniref:sigma-54-dependent transcriptional regulator n=1 Tax=Thalassoglobus sp. JC818 TaxID=3232136 RepID=UPI0034593A16